MLAGQTTQLLQVGALQLLPVIRQPHQGLFDCVSITTGQTLPKVKMPNRDGFIVRFPDAM